MATSNNSTSLYSFTSNTVVSKNDYTTLYNSTPGNVVTGNVPDRNFTTLYTKQSDIRPTLPYGNSNVESFLNVGSDSGGNQVQNIVLHGNITVGQNSYLGNVDNVHINGGNLNYILQTDGAGHLHWAPLPPPPDANVTSYIHFDVLSTGNNQNFTNSGLIVYTNSNLMAVFKNGINIEPSQYSISGSTLTINIPLNFGDTIDVLPSTNGGGSIPGGNLTEVQYNGGSTLSGNSNFTFDQGSSTLHVTNIDVGLVSGSANLDILVVNNDSFLGGASNVHIYGGNVGEVLGTDGAGNLSWITGGGGGNGTPGGSNSYVQYNDNGNFGGKSTFTFNETTDTLSVTNIVGNITTANYSNYSGSATTANSAISAGTSISANIANYAVYVTGGSQSNIIQVGTLNSLTVGYGSGIVNFIDTSNVSLGNVSNLHITGGSGGQYLTTNGSGGLSWSTATVTSANYANYAGDVVNSNQSNITTVGTLTSLVVSGNISTSNYFVGNGSLLSSITGSNVTGTVSSATTATTATTAGTVTTNAQPNITSVGTLTSLSVTGNVSASYYTGNGSLLSGITSTNANYANYAGTVTGGVQSNIYSLGQLTSLDVNGLVNIGGNVIITGAGNGNLRVDGNLDAKQRSLINYAFERFNDYSGSAAGGSQNFIVSSGPIQYFGSAATSNITLDVVGSLTDTFDSILPTGNTATIAFLNTVGTTPYIVSVFKIDGVVQTVKYVNGISPTVGTRLSNCVQSYTFTMIKTNTATYTVLGSLTEYK